MDEIKRIFTFATRTRIVKITTPKYDVLIVY